MPLPQLARLPGRWSGVPPVPVPLAARTGQLLCNTCEGPNATTVTTGLSGFSSGAAGWSIPFNLITISGAGQATLAYDTSRSPHGTSSIYSAVAKASAGSFTATATWTNTSAAPADGMFFRGYFFLTHYGASNTKLLTLLNSAGTTNATFFTDASTSSPPGRMYMNDAASVRVFSGSTSCPQGAWFRLEGYISQVSGESWLARWDGPNMDSAGPPDEYLSHAPGSNLGTVNCGRAAFGASGAAGGCELWFADVGISNQAALGPVLNFTAPGGVPLATPASPVGLAAPFMHQPGRFPGLPWLALGGAVAAPPAAAPAPAPVPVISQYTGIF